MDFYLLNLSAFRDLKEENSCTESFVIKNRNTVDSGDCIWAIWLHWTAVAL